jgi:hypothetical protein
MSPPNGSFKYFLIQVPSGPAANAPPPLPPFGVAGSYYYARSHFSDSNDSAGLIDWLRKGNWSLLRSLSCFRIETTICNQSKRPKPMSSSDSSCDDELQFLLQDMVNKKTNLLFLLLLLRLLSSRSCGSTTSCSRSRSGNSAARRNLSMYIRDQLLFVC